jgi:hypothetical protein
MFFLDGNNLKDILMAIDELGFITVNHIIWNNKDYRYAI